MEKKITIELTEKELGAINNACNYFMHALDGDCSELAILLSTTLEDLYASNGKMEKAWNEIHKQL